MKKNMGSLDKTLRGLAGVIIIAAGIYYGSWWGAIGVVLLFTSLSGFCPGYLPFNISTRKPESSGGSPSA